MRIAFVSYEYPPDTADGGIGTYAEQAARMLHARGHDVEVFAAGRERTGTFDQEGILIHRVRVALKPEFAAAIAPVFALRSELTRFDVMEGPDFNADARFAAEADPRVALVVRLHTPRYLTVALNTFDSGSSAHNTVPEYLYPQDYEYQHAAQADLLTAPSAAIRDRICHDWRLSVESVEVIPNVYSPSRALLDTPIATDTRTVTYIGRLEHRKGVLQLAAAIPEVLRQSPDTRFRFVGRALPSPDPAVDMREYLQQRLGVFSGAVEFTGPVPLSEIPTVLSETDICAFPSLWENFPCVCLEAMSAGRGIVGSMRGGMAEMLTAGTGLLVDPLRDGQIAGAILQILARPEERYAMGMLARERVQKQYGPETLAPLLEAIYIRAIERRRAGGNPPAR